MTGGNAVPGAKTSRSKEFQRLKLWMETIDSVRELESWNLRHRRKEKGFFEAINPRANLVAAEFVMSTRTCNTTIAGRDYRAKIVGDGEVIIDIDSGESTARGLWRQDRIVELEPPLPKIVVETLEDELKI